MNENGGNTNFNRNNLMFRSTDGGNAWTSTYTGPAFVGPHRSNSGYFATMYSSPAYWRHMGWGQPAALNGVVHYVYASRNTATGDPGNVFYIRSTDRGQTFSAPFQLNTNTDPTKSQWQPNISVSSTGGLFAVWYDERERAAASCQPSSPSTSCYRMWARRSTDNGATWLASDAFSDGVTPLPLQPDPGIQTTYAGDYDFASSSPDQHLHAWVDGRVTISGNSRGLQSAGTAHTVDLSWTGTTSISIDVYRNVTVPNNGFYTDHPNGRGHAMYTYRVCEASTGTCSNQVTVTF